MQGFVELLEGGDCHDILLEVVGSQHLVGDDGKHGGDETVASLKQRWVRKSITMSLSMPLPLLDQTYFQSLLHQTAPYRHHTFILHLVLFDPASDMTFIEQFAFPPCVILDLLHAADPCIHLHMRKAIPPLTSQSCLVRLT